MTLTKKELMQRLVKQLINEMYDDLTLIRSE